MWIDITPPVSSQTPVFPGDTVFHAEPVMEIASGAPVSVSRITMSPHTGAHADAPLHYHADGAPIDQVDVGVYIGPCIVINVTNAAPAVTAERLAGALGNQIAPRILIRTYIKHPHIWDDEFTAIDAGAITWLAEKGVILIGVDTPSLDPAASKTMDAHHAIYKTGMGVLEGLLLDHVDEGQYELIAPPLKLKDADASPVRALLRPLA